jgi:hypothetical protein
MTSVVMCDDSSDIVAWMVEQTVDLVFRSRRVVVRKVSRK